MHLNANLSELQGSVPYSERPCHEAGVRVSVIDVEARPVPTEPRHVVLVPSATPAPFTASLERPASPVWVIVVSMCAMVFVATLAAGSAIKFGLTVGGPLLVLLSIQFAAFTLIVKRISAGHVRR